MVTKSVEPFSTAVGVPARSRPQATVSTRTTPELSEEVQTATARPSSPNVSQMTKKILSCPLEVKGAHMCTKKCDNEIYSSTESNLDVPLQ